MNQDSRPEPNIVIDEQTSLDEVPSSQKRQLSKSLADYLDKATSRNEAIIKAYRSGGYSMVEIVNYFGLHYSSIIKIIKAGDNSKFKT